MVVANEKLSKLTGGLFGMYVYILTIPFRLVIFTLLLHMRFLIEGGLIMDVKISCDEFHKLIEIGQYRKLVMLL